MAGTRVMSAVSAGLISVEGHGAAKDVPFPLPRGYSPVCCTSHWPPTQCHAPPAPGEERQAARPELLPWGLRCRWSTGALLPLSPLSSIPSGSNCRPQPVKMTQGHSCVLTLTGRCWKEPDGFSIKLLAPLRRGVLKARKPSDHWCGREGAAGQAFPTPDSCGPKNITNLWGLKSAHQNDDLYPVR